MELSRSEFLRENHSRFTYAIGQISKKFMSFIERSEVMNMHMEEINENLHRLVSTLEGRPIIEDPR